MSLEPYRSTGLGIPEIAEQLRVSAVIEGSVRVDDDRIRITVQLIEAQTDRHLWADSFDRLLSVQNIFSIQEEVARQIALALQGEYADIAEPDPVQLPTANLDAYTAEAFAILGWTYSFLATNYGNMLPGDAYPKAKEAALKAITLDSDLSDAPSLYADILTWYDWDFEAAEREYRKTMDLDPLNVLGYALFLSIQERHEEAIVLVERRLQANPDDPYVDVNAAWRFLSARRYDRAIEYFESDLKDRGRLPQQLSNPAIAYYRSGQQAQARELLVELKAMAADRFISPALLASVYFASGDADNGFASLQNAVNAKVRDVLFFENGAC